MVHDAKPLRIIAHASRPDVPRLRAIAREMRWRLWSLLWRSGPRSAPPVDEATALPSLTLLELCREAIEALDPDAHKLYLGDALAAIGRWLTLDGSSCRLADAFSPPRHLAAKGY